MKAGKTAGKKSKELGSKLKGFMQGPEDEHPTTSTSNHISHFTEEG